MNDDLESLYSAAAFADTEGPDTMMTTLDGLRYICSKKEPGAGVKEFLEKTKDLDGHCGVFITRETVALME